MAESRVAKLFADLATDRDVWEAWGRDQDRVMERYQLDDGEKAAVTSGSAERVTRVICHPDDEEPPRRPVWTGD